MSAEASDEQLAIRAGSDPQAFGVLMMRYQDKLMRYIIRKSSVPPEIAEDVLQESFIKAYQNINSFDADLSFSSWMYRIVHNTTISHWRKENIRPEGNQATVDDAFLAKIVDEGDLVADIDQDFLRQNIDRILRELPEKYREVLVLKYIDDKNYTEISDILKKPMGTVATLLHRAKAQFKKQCEKSQDVEIFN